MTTKALTTMPRAHMVSDDIRTLTFAVVDKTGAAVDLSGYTDIDVELFATAGGLPTGAAIVTENLAGDVALLGGGTGGRFSLGLVAADTTAISGVHWLEVRLEDASGFFVTAGRVYVDIEADLIVT